MAQIRYRANLSAKDFVFSAQQWGRSVVMKQYDQNFSRQIVSPTDPDKDIGIPQVFYCHNVMPCAQGFQSVSTNIVHAPAATNTGGMFYITDYEDASTGAAGELGFENIGGNQYHVWALPVGLTTWVLVGLVNVNPAFVGFTITTANIQGLVYIMIPGTNCYTFDGTTFAPVILTGLTINTILGITASFGYMIAYSETAVAWSSTISATDFTPSLITGAGGGGVSALPGTITACFPHTFGFILFSSTAAVAAVYSGNARFPFNFRPIIACGGIESSSDLVAIDAESGNLYAYTSAGLQLVSVTQAQVVFPELTNYISGSRFEDFNDTTFQFSYTDVEAGTFVKRLAVVSQRYLCLSYGLTSYTHCLVYDLSMKRWGKLKVPHVQMFQLRGNNANDTARVSLCFMDDNGTITGIGFDNIATSGGTIILGKYQHARDRLITLQTVDVEFCAPGVTGLWDLPTLDGKTFLPAVPLFPTAASSVTNAPSFTCRITGMNHSLVMQGVFQLDSLMLTYIPNGRR